MTGVIAVHCGAGEHKEKNFSNYNRLCKLASKKGIEILNNGGSAADAVKAAVMILEDNPLTNAGVGSNLTNIGSVEMDASLMDGKSLLCGGCGAVSKVKNPIALAYEICMNQSIEHPLGLVPPSLLVGRGSQIYAKRAGLKLMNKKYFLTQKTLNQFKKYTRLLEKISLSKLQKRADTVGAVCIDNEGHVASACSSGGLILKQPGRVGQAALYACGVWADSFNPISENCVAVSTTGCGEYLVQTQLAREIAKNLKDVENFPTVILSQTMREKFLNSRHLQNIKQKMGGALVIHKSPNGIGEILWGHTTATMSIGFMKTTDSKPTGMVSQLPKDVEAGTTINVGGHNFVFS